MIQYQILQTNMKITWQTVRRITNKILGVKGLPYSHAVVPIYSRDERILKDTTLHYFYE